MRWIYSDTGYAIAGAMMERATGRSWEELLRDRLFRPLGLDSAGFGEPASADQVDQPWGHRGERRLQAVPPARQMGYPPAIGPAASVHMSVVDFARYAAWHVAGARGAGTLLTPSSFAKLHATSTQEGYAMGWVVHGRRWAAGKVLTHTGQNHAVMWVAPEQNTCFVAVSNADNAAAADACDDAIAKLIKGF